MPRASIIITTHNRSSLVKRAIDSARSAGKDVEVIVVDDASTDDTEKVCRPISGINYIRLERNQRTAGARNIGIVASNSPYVAFLDDDDWRLPGSIDKQIEVFTKYPDCGLVYGQFLFENQKGERLDEKPVPAEFPQGDVFWRILNGNFIGCLTAVFKKECLYQIGLLDTSSKMYGIEDLDLWIRIAEFYQFRAVEEPVGVYRKPELNSNQWSSNQTKQLSLIAKAYKNKWLKLPRVINEQGIHAEAEKNSIFRNMSETMIYDMAHNSKGRMEKVKKLLQIIECYPHHIKRLVFYKTIAKTILLKRN